MVVSVRDGWPSLGSLEKQKKHPKRSGQTAFRYPGKSRYVALATQPRSALARYAAIAAALSPSRARKDWQRGGHIKPGFDYFQHFHDSVVSVAGLMSEQVRRPVLILLWFLPVRVGTVS